MDVTIPAYGKFLNANGIVKINSDLFQFRRDVIKILTGGSVDRIPQLLKQQSTGNGIQVIPVTRIINNSSSGRVQAVSSCTSTIGNYRLIAYEEWVASNLPGGCGPGLVLHNYYLRLRSLHKILGTWQNHKTHYLKSAGDLKISHWVDCDPCPSNQHLLVNTPYQNSNYSITCPYDHTCHIYFLQNYDAGPCSSRNTCANPNNYHNSYISIEINNHHAHGKNSTNCQFGF